MYNLAMITARGGSVGIPRKNLQTIEGQTLIGRCVETARAVPSVDDVCVVTDDDEIAAEAYWWGAKIIKRDHDDGSSSEKSLLLGLDEYRRKRDRLPDFITFLQCTSPFLRKEDVEEGFMRVIVDKFDMAFGVVPDHGFMWQWDYDGKPLGVGHNHRTRPLRQDRIPQLRETGGFYVMRTRGFLRAKHRFFGSMCMIRCPVWTGLDIDTPEDLQMARAQALLLASGRLHLHTADNLPGA